MTVQNHTPRAELKDANPKIYPLMREFGAYLETSSIGAKLRHLIKVRASQINRCAFCLDMHLREARHDGVSQDLLDLLSVWREAPHFTEEERAALELTEAVTLIADAGVSDVLYTHVREHFTNEQFIDLLTTINVINSWNRYMIAMGHTAPLRPSSGAS